jgi:glucose-1-phosphate thymidylyltransferase
MKGMKGILLAGGSGSRLFPLTTVVSKQLLPVYDKPLLYYPLATLMLADIRETLVITTRTERSMLEALLGDGSQWGLSLQYAEQSEANGIAEALIIGQEFLAGDAAMLILGDNIFFGHGLQEVLETAKSEAEGATIFGYWVPDPERFGVVEFSEAGTAISIEEKPAKPRSNYAVPGLYIYDFRASEIARNLTPSKRGELEITDVNLRYLEMGALKVRRLQRGFAWLDAGTPDALLDAANFMATLERRQGLKIACLEEIAWRKGWIDRAALHQLTEAMPATSYREYLTRLSNED